MLTFTVTGKLNLAVLLEEAQDAANTFQNRTPLFSSVLQDGLINIEVSIAPGAENSERLTRVLYQKQFERYTSVVSNEIVDVIIRNMRYFTKVTITRTYIEDVKLDKDELLDPEDKGEDPAG